MITQLSDMPTQDLSEKEKENIKKELEVNVNKCLNIAKDLPKANKILNDLLKKINDEQVNDMYLRNTGVINQIGMQCDSVSSLYVEAPEKKTKNEECEHCMNNISVFMPSSGRRGYSSAQYMSLQMIKTMLTNKKMKDENCVLDKYHFEIN